MKKKLLAAVLVGTAISLAACGGNKENTLPEKQMAAETKGGSIKEAKEQKENSKSALFSQVNLSGFGNVGNNPNNLKENFDLDSMAFDENFIYFAYEGNLYKADYSGEHVTLLIDDYASNLNLHGGYLYYVESHSQGKRYNLETGEYEIFLKREAGKDLNRSGKVYKAYHTANNFFIVDDYLFYTDTEGYDGTSEAGSTKVMVMDLTDMTDIAEVKEGSVGAYTTDGEYVYAIGDSMYRILLEDIESGKMMEEWNGYRSGEMDTYILGSDGYYFANDEAYYMHQFENAFTSGSNSAEPTEILNFEEFAWGSIDIPDGVNVILGDTFFNLTENRRLYCFKNMDFENPEYLEEVSNENTIDVLGISNNKLYLVDSVDGTMRLSVVDEDGNYTQTALVPEIVEEEVPIVGEYNEYNTYFSTEPPADIPNGTEITYPEGTNLKYRNDLSGYRGLEFAKEKDENGEYIRETYYNSKGNVERIIEWSPDFKEQRQIYYKEDGTLDYYVLATMHENRENYITRIFYNPDRTERKRLD